MISRKNILKKIDVLLFFVIILLSAVSVTANLNSNKITIMSLSADYNHGISRRSFVIWDNNLTYGEGLIACQYEPYYGELGTCADDFIFNSSQEIRDVHWIGGFWQGPPASFDWQITFYNDDDTGTRPGTILAGPFFFLNADCNEVFLEQIDGDYFYEWMVSLEEPVVCSEGVKYWVGFQGQGIFPPQSGMAVHTSPQQMHQCKFKSEFYGYPDWTDSYDAFGEVFDLAFQMSGPVEDTIPPVTIPTIEGFLYMGGIYVAGPINITLNATDDASGVNYTMYTLDDGNWTVYTQPFKVHKWGTYVLYYYSVDTAGNFEEIKNVSFTLKLSPVDIIFTPGLHVGIQATIRHNATTVLSDFECHYILINDFGLLLYGDSHQMPIDTLAPGEFITMYDFPFGFCVCSHISVSIWIPSQLKGFTYGVNNKLIVLGPFIYLK